MSRLEELITDLCPDGVEYKTIEEIATDIFRGSGIKRDEVTEEGIPCVRYGEIYTTYGVWFDECVSHTNESVVASKKYFEYGDILFAITGESVEDIAKSCAYVGHEKCLAGGDIVVLKHNQNPKYLSYALSTTYARLQKSKGKVKSKVVHSSVPAIKSIRIPIPPLEIQEEIAVLLDNFMMSHNNLECDLTEELGCRKIQFEYYKDKIFSFDGIEYNTVENAMEFTNGKGHERSVSSDGKYIVVNSKFISTNGEVKKYSDNQIVPVFKDDILMVMSDLPNGRALARTFFVEQDDTFTLNQRICRLAVLDRNEYIPKFLYYYLDRNPQLLAHDNGIDQTNLKKGDILEVKLPKISLEKQRSMVENLDSLTTWYDELTNAVISEIENRQKQYEFYRDRLICLKEKTA